MRRQDTGREAPWLFTVVIVIGVLAVVVASTLAFHGATGEEVRRERMKLFENGCPANPLTVSGPCRIGGQREQAFAAGPMRVRSTRTSRSDRGRRTPARC